MEKANRFEGIDGWLFNLMPKWAQKTLRGVEWALATTGFFVLALLFWDYLVIGVLCVLVIWGAFKVYGAWQEHMRLLRKIAGK